MIPSRDLLVVHHGRDFGGVEDWVGVIADIAPSLRPKLFDYARRTRPRSVELIRIDSEWSATRGSLKSQSETALGVNAYAW
jgi:hypothetical protein